MNEQGVQVVLVKWPVSIDMFVYNVIVGHNCWTWEALEYTKRISLVQQRISVCVVCVLSVIDIG